VVEPHRTLLEKQSVADPSDAVGVGVSDFGCFPATAAEV